MPDVRRVDPARMSQFRRLLLISLLAMFAAACPAVRGPAGFWKAYRPDLVVERHSDQGPWGGERSIRWHASVPGTFKPASAQAFAEANGWVLMDCIPYSPPPEGAPRLYAGAHSPALLAVPSTLMRFDSRWIRENPGSGTTNVAIRYVQVASDGTAQYVFHFWGNG